MPWYMYSLPTSFSLVGLYLCIKWLTSRGLEPKQILLFMSGFACLGFLAVAAPSLSAVVRSSQFPGFLAAATFAGVFAAIGHWADFEAIKRAPNPGFATALRNCSILPVTVFSVFLFGSAFDLLKLAGAGLILAGVVALVVERKAAAGARGTGRAAGKRWVVLALVAVASYTLMVFGIKKATLLGFSAPEICLTIYIVNFAFFAAVCRTTVRAFLRDKAKRRLFLPVTLVCALFAVAANLLNVKGLQLAPNPGYHEAIRSTNLLFITLLAIPLFSASLDRQKMVGVAVIVAGMILLVV